jgi:tRNA-specific 2-thiouridylase
MTTAVAVSGGVDSLCALHLLKREDARAFAVHAHFLPPTPDALDRQDRLARICSELDVPLHVLDVSRTFRERVIEPFISSYVRGLTPNPCAWCNREAKFGLILSRALELGADRLATGHYARTATDASGRPSLWRGVDPDKEQSYFLSLLTPAQIGRARFPLGEWTKEQVRREMGRRVRDLPEKSESQEICFVPGDDYRGFLESQGIRLPGQGPILDSSGRELGRHSGLHRFTVGQRRGIGVAFSEPLYVLDKDMGSNALYVGTRRELRSGGCRVRAMNHLVGPGEWPSEVLVQTNYRERPRPAAVHHDERGRAAVRFRSEGRPGTPGQVAAFYTRDGRVLAGGVIDRGTEGGGEQGDSGSHQH